MKKIFSIAAVAMMLMASCAKDSYIGGNTKVTFEVKAPALAEATRDIADGMTATQLYYAVYTADQVLVPGLLPANPVIMQNKGAQISLRLVKGQTYNFLFWAEAPGDTAYTFDAATGTVTVNYAAAKSNNEARDAFYAKVPNFTVGTSTPQPIYLRRPFAQVNMGATAEDVAAALTAGIDITKSQVTFSELPNKLNMWDGSVEGSENVVFDFELTPAKNNEVLEVADVNYHYVAMNYILAEAEGDVTDISFTVKDANDVAINTTYVPAANYKRNYRTNILGSLLTSSTEFEIVIDEKPFGDINY